jgi:hypothetical protein
MEIKIVKNGKIICFVLSLIASTNMYRQVYECNEKRKKIAKLFFISKFKIKRVNRNEQSQNFETVLFFQIFFI